MFKTCSVHPVHLTFLTSQIVYRNLEVEHLNLGFTFCLAKKVNKTFVKDGVDHEFLQPNIGIFKKEKNNFQLFVFVREFDSSFVLTLDCAALDVCVLLLCSTQVLSCYL